jgi:hypothetical protein
MTVMVGSGDNLGPIGVVTWLRFATAPADQRDRLRQTVAALYTGHGGGIDGSRLDVARGAAVSRAAVAAASRGVSKPGGGKWHDEVA